MFAPLAMLAVLILVGTSLYLLLSQNWRWSVLALALQYLAVFLLTGLVWPLGLAAVKLVTGWMAGAVLSAAQPTDAFALDAPYSRTTLIFRLLLGGLVLILVLALVPAIATRLPEPVALLNGGMLIIGMGLIHLGVTTRPLRVVLGLLTCLSGFELIYAGVENSILVVGLLAVVTLGLALVGAYLLDSQSTGAEDR